MSARRACVVAPLRPVHARKKRHAGTQAGCGRCARGGHQPYRHCAFLDALRLAVMIVMRRRSQVRAAIVVAGASRRPRAAGPDGIRDERSCLGRALSGAMGCSELRFCAPACRVVTPFLPSVIPWSTQIKPTVILEPGTRLGIGRPAVLGRVRKVARPGLRTATRRDRTKPSVSDMSIASP